MKTLWTFGGSFTEGYTDKHKWSVDYIKWKGYTPKVYGDIIAEKLDLDLKNMGEAGICNYTVLEKICEQIHNIKDDDIIIVNWAPTIRFRLVDQSEKNWISLRPGNNNNIDNFDKMISQSTLDEIFVNRDTELYQMEIINWIKLLNKTFKSNVIIHWTHEMSGTNLWNFSQYNRIKNETNDELKDHHPSEMGHIELANRLISIINKNII
jgi:hypothetical protein